MATVLNRLRTTALLVVVFGGMFCLGHLLYTYSFRAVESYPSDTWLAQVEHKVALVVVAHDDDAATMAGTIAHLRATGWTVDLLTFYQGSQPHVDSLRKTEAQRAARLQGIRNLHLVDLDMQHTRLTQVAIPYAEFPTAFRIDSIAGVLRRVLVASKPSLLLSLDDVIGGYGHAEHVLIGQLAIRTATQTNQAGLTAVQRVYQTVYPPSMADRMMQTQPVYRHSQAIYQVKGMPEASVSVPIAAYGAEKMATLKSYASQHRNLKKFVKHYHLYPAWLYFRIFDREYFRVVPLPATSA